MCNFPIAICRCRRITLWNCRFFRKLETPAIPTPIPSALPVPPKPTVRDAHEPNTHVPQTKGGEMTSPKGPSIAQPVKITRALSRLLPYLLARL